MKRYAVQFPDGSFSNGPHREPVPFERAKLWKTKGQVTQHLDQRHQGAYPAGCRVVEVDIVATTAALMDVDAYIAQRDKVRAEQRARDEARWAEERLREAERALQRARMQLEAQQAMSALRKVQP